MAYTYNCLLVADLGEGIFHVQLNRASQLNALNQEILDELGDVFSRLDADENCGVVILSGAGRAFCSGIDLTAFGDEMVTSDDMDVARKGRQVRCGYRDLRPQFCFSAVIAAIHGYCVGGGIDITSACDIRNCSSDAQFSEVAIGLADVGTLNHLPKIIGNHSWMREVCLTARLFGAEEALDQGLVSRICESYEGVIAAAKETAHIIATSSPVAVQGTKIVLNHARDHPVDESLRYVAMWNMSQLQTDDIPKSAAAAMTKGPKPRYSKL